MLSRDGLVAVALSAGAGQTAYFCPTLQVLADYWRETVATLYPVMTESNVQEKRLRLLGGGSIDMWSLTEPNAARGRKYAHVAIDEAAMVPRLGEAWQEVIRPTLSDLRGSAEFYSTPRGRNFFWQLWQRGQDPARADWASWQMPTAANPFIKASEIEAARRELPERVFAQEYLAQFLENSGGVFRRVLEAATARPQELANLTTRYLHRGGWGRASDFTCICVIDTPERRAGLQRPFQPDRIFPAVGAAAGDLREVPPGGGHRRKQLHRRADHRPVAQGLQHAGAPFHHHQRDRRRRSSTAWRWPSSAGTSAFSRIRS